MTSLTFVVVGTFPRVRVMLSFGVPVNEFGSSRSIGVDAIAIVYTICDLAGTVAHRIAYIECVINVLC